MKGSLKKNVGTVVLGLGFSLVALQGSAANKVKLQMKLREGDRYTMQFTTQQSINQTIMDTKQTITQATGIGALMEVTDVTDQGWMTTKTTYQSIQMKQNQNGREVIYDSAKPADAQDPKAKIFQSLLNKSFVITFAPDGTVKAVSGIQELVDGMLSTIELPETLKTQFKTQLNEQFGEQAIKSMFEESMKFYPQTPVAIGESWQARQVLSRSFSAIADTTWTLKEVRNRVATIAVDGTVQPDPNAKPMPLGPFMMRHTLAGRQQGTMTVQLRDGMVSRSELKRSLAGKMFATGLPGQPKEMSWPTTIESTISVEQHRTK
jgi:hypothetical protein